MLKIRDCPGDSGTVGAYEFRDINTQNQYTKAENEAEIVELKSKNRALETQREQYARQLREKQEQHEFQLIKEREQLEIQLAKQKELFAEERETNRKLMSDLSREITTLQAAVSRLQSDIIDRDTVIQTRKAVVKRKNSEL